MNEKSRKQRRNLSTDVPQETELSPLGRIREMPMGRRLCRLLSF
jgi:hypothetical protein